MQRLFLFTLFLILASGPFIMAQTGCVLTLQEAERLYEQGRYDEVPGKLESCMEKGFNREERLQAYKLVFQSLYMEDKLTEAEQTMELFLKKYPEYELTPADPAEFVQVFNTYKTTAAWSLSIGGGGLLTLPYMTEPYAVSNTSSNTASYSTGPGYFAGIGVHKYLSKKFEIILEIQYMNHEYSFVQDHVTNQFPVSDNVNQTSFKEKITNIAFPLTGTYEFITGKWRPFVRAGVMGTYTVSALLDPRRIYTNNAFPDVEGTDIDMLELRNKMNIYGLVGAGLKYKIPYGGLIYLDFRFSVGFTSPHISIARYDQPELLYTYFGLDNNYKFNFVSASLGWIYPLYRSKKQPLTEF